MAVRLSGRSRLHWLVCLLVTNASIHVRAGLLPDEPMMHLLPQVEWASHDKISAGRQRQRHHADGSIPSNTFLEKSRTIEGSAVMSRMQRLERLAATEQETIQAQQDQLRELQQDPFLHEYIGGEWQVPQINIKKSGIFLDHIQVDKLIKDKLADTYDMFARPTPDSSVLNGTEVVKIYTSVSFQKLLDLDTTKGVANMVVRLRLMWPDYRLKYNASQYFRDRKKSWDSSSDFVTISQSRVWVPNVQLLNAVQKSEVINDDPRVYWYDEQKLLESGYNMAAVWPETIHVQCPVSMLAFPYDKQRCQVKFGDASASEQRIQIATRDRFASADMPEEHSEFSFDNITVSSQIINEGTLADGAKVPAVVYEIAMSRKPHYYLLKFVLPMFLLVLFGQSVYWMDQGDGRLSNGITVVLAVMIVSFLTAGMMPYSPEVMWLERFQVGCYILTCLPVFVSILLDHFATTLSERDGVEQQIQACDVIARLVHPVLVLVFYFVMFPMFEGWTNGQTDINVFFLFNVLIFVLFFAVAVWNCIGFKGRVAREVQRSRESRSSESLKSEAQRAGVEVVGWQDPR